jgi:hypothetical protein
VQDMRQDETTVVQVPIWIKAEISLEAPERDFDALKWSRLSEMFKTAAYFDDFSTAVSNSLIGSRRAHKARVTGSFSLDSQENVLQRNTM